MDAGAGAVRAGRHRERRARARSPRWGPRADAAIGGAAALLVLPPPRWEEAGLIAGATAGALLEYRAVRSTPAGTAQRQRWVRAGVGLGGLLALLGLSRLAGSVVPLLGPLLAAMAALWAVLGAPALSARVGLAGQRVRPGQPSSQERTLPRGTDPPSSGSHGRGAGGDEP